MLETGGILRILTPDLKKISAYVNNDLDFLEEPNQKILVRTDLGIECL